MAFVAGIDEAGYGPVLGPLVVSTAVFELPDELLDVPMWKLLAGTVSPKPSRRPGTLAIGDSKRLYSRKRAKALEHLERGVLAMLATRGRRPRGLRSLLKIVAPQAVPHLAKYPWYASANVALPRCISETDAALAGNALASAMARASVRLDAMRCEVVLAGEFNRTVRATNNKSTTLFDVTSRLLAYLWRKLPPGRVAVHADRHGGRIRYLAPLQRVFAGCDFKVLDETQAVSAYRIRGGPRSMDLRFGVDLDRHCLPTAMASMLSKYVRELFMALLNRYWAVRVPKLAATAGYYADGRRFLADIAAAVREAGADETLLRRCR